METLATPRLRPLTPFFKTKSLLRAGLSLKLLSHAREVDAGELATLIRVENLGLAMFGQRLLERLDTKIGFHGVENIAQALWSGAIDPAVTLSYRGL